jgi:hypothetical protein
MLPAGDEIRARALQDPSRQPAHPGSLTGVSAEVPGAPPGAFAPLQDLLQPA